MNRNQNSSFIFILVSTVLMLVLQSCTVDTECKEELSVVLTVGVKTVKDNKVQALTVDSLWVNGLENPLFVMSNVKNASKFSVSLKNSQIQTEYILRFNNTRDTITVLYTTNPDYFISLACGCIATHTIDEVLSTKNYIDSVKITNRSITQQSAEHVQIFHN